MSNAADRIVSEIRQAIESGEYKPGDRLPSQRALAERHGVSNAVPAAAFAELRRMGLIETGGAAGSYVAHDPEALADWPMTGRYAKARAARGLVFASDHSGEIEKRTISVERGAPDRAIADLLGSKAHVVRRQSRTYLDGVPVEMTSMHFPVAVINDAPELETAESIKVVEMIEQTGRTIGATNPNYVTARPATKDEADILRIDPGGYVFEHLHLTAGADGEPLEAVRNVRSTKGNRLVFHTNERPLGQQTESE